MRTTEPRDVIVLLDAAEREMGTLCASSGGEWRMTIPPRDTDTDLVLSDALRAARAEILRLRRYAELTISLCEWGPSADFEGDEGDLWAYAMEAQILRVVPHAQPCAIEDCGCAGADELCDFAWRADA